MSENIESYKKSRNPLTWWVTVVHQNDSYCTTVKYRINGIKRDEEIHEGATMVFTEKDLIKKIPYDVEGTFGLVNMIRNASIDCGNIVNEINFKIKEVADIAKRHQGSENEVAKWFESKEASSLLREVAFYQAFIKMIKGKKAADLLVTVDI